MSSILDALEKLESRRTQSGGPELPHRVRRSSTPLLAGAAVAAFAAGIGLAAVWLRPTSSPPAPAPVALVAPPPTMAQPAPPLTMPRAPAQPAPPAPPAARGPEQPWAEVVVPAAPRDVPAAAAQAGGVARAPAMAAPQNPEAAPIVASATHPAAVVPAPAPPSPAAAAPASRSAARPAGAPGVRVSFLVYSSAPERRTVALAIDQNGLVTLHEGESSNGVSVAQILSDGVELTWQGQSFKVRARD